MNPHFPSTALNSSSWCALTSYEKCRTTGKWVGMNGRRKEKSLEAHRFTQVDPQSGSDVRLARVRWAEQPCPHIGKLSRFMCARILPVLELWVVPFIPTVSHVDNRSGKAQHTEHGKVSTYRESPYSKTARFYRQSDFMSQEQISDFVSPHPTAWAWPGRSHDSHLCTRGHWLEC